MNGQVPIGPGWSLARVKSQVPGFIAENKQDEAPRSSLQVQTGGLKHSGRSQKKVCHQAPECVIKHVMLSHSYDLHLCNARPSWSKAIFFVRQAHGFLAKAAMLRSSPYSGPLPAFSDTRPTYSRDAQDDEIPSYEDSSGTLECSWFVTGLTNQAQNAHCCHVLLLQGTHLCCSWAIL